MITSGDGELDNLKNAIRSVEGIFSSVYITANGNDVVLTKAFCKDKGYDYSFLPWDDDFSKQRNFNFSQVADADYIFWMDCDDVVVNPKVLLDIATVSKQNEYDCVFFTYWYGAKFNGKPSRETFEDVELSQNRERLIRPGSIVWKKRLHETPVPIDDSTFKYTRVEYSKEYPVAWLHLGADRDISQEVMEKRMARNRRILELELQDERKEGQADPRTLLYLMKIYTEDNDEKILRECIEMGKEYMAKSGWDQERAVCCRLMSVCMGKLGRDLEASKLLHEAISEWPYDPLLYLYLARSYFNMKKFNAMKHWMGIGLNLDTKDDNTQMHNILDMKVLAAELMMQYNLYGKRDIRKAYESAKLLNKLNPQPEHEHNEQYLHNQTELDKACENAHKLMDYYKSIQREDLIPSVVDSMPTEMKRLPFAVNHFNRYKEPKTWGSNEICYYATFGGEHFEKWDGDSLKAGIGGSETAVIRLSEELTNLGWKVTVYGDPLVEKTINGVLYKPYYMFNARDNFNVFIQWRSASMAGKVACKRYYVDLHDVYHPSALINKIDSIGKIFVKSDYHKSLGEGIPDYKFEVVSNGI